jgi:hypothetical protein
VVEVVVSLDTRLTAGRWAEELRAVLVDAIERYAAESPDAPADYIAESVEVHATFGQAWPSTCGGFGGAGGQMMTGSQTWVVTCSGSRMALVYFGARLAHATDDELWLRECIQKRRFPMSHMPWIKPGDPIPLRRQGAGLTI